MKTTDQQTAAPATWAPPPVELSRLQAEASEAIQQATAGEPITEEQANLILWDCSPLPLLFAPAHLEG